MVTTAAASTAVAVGPPTAGIAAGVVIGVGVALVSAMHCHWWDRLPPFPKITEISGEKERVPEQ